MKKIIIVGALLIFAAGSASAASIKFADTDAGSSLGATAPANMVIGKTSKGVKIQVTYDDVSGTAYSMQTVHLSGSKIYGTAYDSTAIWVAPPTDGVAKDIFDANELISSTGDPLSAEPCFTGWSTL